MPGPDDARADHVHNNVVVTDQYDGGDHHDHDRRADDHNNRQCDDNNYADHVNE